MDEWIYAWMCIPQVLTEQDSGGQGADIEDVQPQNLPAIGEMELMAGWSEHVSESTGKT